MYDEDCIKVNQIFFEIPLNKNTDNQQPPFVAVFLQMSNFRARFKKPRCNNRNRVIYRIQKVSFFTVYTRKKKHDNLGTESSSFAF